MQGIEPAALCKESKAADVHSNLILRLASHLSSQFSDFPQPVKIFLAAIWSSFLWFKSRLDPLN